MSRLGEIGQNINLWVKMDEFWPKKGHKRGEKDFFQNIHWVILVIDHGTSFKYAKLAKSYERIGRNWPKCQLMGQNGRILAKKGHKRGEKDFCQNFHWVILVIDHGSSFNMQN